MNCLIVAAGQGARLREKLELKPLIPLRGVPLIQHVMDRARHAGIDRFTVVSGYRGDELRRYLDAAASRDGTHIAHVVNDEWHRANGVSVLKAEPFLDGPFLLTMCDHVVDPDIFRRLMARQPPAEGVVLAADFNIDDPLNDPEDVTRVKSDDGQYMTERDIEELLLDVGRLSQKEAKIVVSDGYKALLKHRDGGAEEQDEGLKELSNLLKQFKL